jgi:hypothetical protein
VLNGKKDEAVFIFLKQSFFFVRKSAHFYIDVLKIFNEPDQKIHPLMPGKDGMQNKQESRQIKKSIFIFDAEIH